MFVSLHFELEFRVNRLKLSPAGQKISSKFSVYRSYRKKSTEFWDCHNS